MAAESATAIGSLIVQDARPILVLTTYDARVFTSVAKLKRLIAAGQVRYAFLNTFCTPHGSSVNPACSAPVQVDTRARDRRLARGGPRPRQAAVPAAGGAAMSSCGELAAA